MSNPLDKDLNHFREFRISTLQQFGIRTWDSIFVIGKCSSCGEERVGGVGSVVGIEFGRFDRFESQLLKMLSPTAACKKCQGQTQPIGLLYCTYYPETKTDLHVFLKREPSGPPNKTYSKISLDEKITLLGPVANEDEFRDKFGMPFSIRGEWAKIVRESAKTRTPQFLTVQEGYLISCWPSSISKEELERVRKSLDDLADKYGLNFGDYLSEGPKRNVEVKESFEAWLDDFADLIRKGELKAFGLVSSQAFIAHLKREFPEYTLEFPPGFHAMKSPIFRCKRGELYIDASIAGYLVTAIHRGLSFNRIARGFFATATLDRLDLMYELFGKLKRVFSDYAMSIEEGKTLVLRDKSSDKTVKSWDLYKFEDEFTVDFPRFLREKMGYEPGLRKFYS